MLEQEKEYYKANLKELAEKYPNKWIVIADEAVWGVFDSVLSASMEALKHFKTSKFITRCPSDDAKAAASG